MSWSGIFPEGEQHRRCLKTRHPVGNCHSGRGSPAAGVGQEVPENCIGSRPCFLRYRQREQSDRVFSADSRGGGTNEPRLVRKASR